MPFSLGSAVFRFPCRTRGPPFWHSFFFRINRDTPPLDPFSPVPRYTFPVLFFFFFWGRVAWLSRRDLLSNPLFFSLSCRSDVSSPFSGFSLPFSNFFPNNQVLEMRRFSSLPFFFLVCSFSFCYAHSNLFSFSLLVSNILLYHLVFC